MENNIKKIKTMVRVRLGLLYGAISIAAIAVLLPFYWMLLTAVKSNVDITAIPPKFFVTDIHLENFVKAFKQAPFALYFRNTLIVAIFSTLGTVLTTILAAFAFSRLQFRGRDLLFTILLGTMMIPGEMLVITNYVTVSRLGWIDTFPALIVPFMTSVFYVFYLRQTFMQIPNELYLAAKVDGTSDFKYLIKVMIPIAKPTIVSITILSALGSWNAYVWPSLVTNSDARRLVTNGLMSSFSDEFGTMQNLQMAASAVVTLPILIVFFLLKKQIMRGVARGGLKG